MYAYIKGQDGHFCLKRVGNRASGRRWIESEKLLYSVVYDDEPVTGVLSDREYAEVILNDAELMERFPTLSVNTNSLRRLGMTLRERVRGAKELIWLTETSD